LKTIIDFEKLIEQCRIKTLKKGERYIALELVLNMILKCGVTAQEIPHITINDVTNNHGKIKNTFASPLYIDQIDIRAVKSDLEDYLMKLQSWNHKKNRSSNRLFPSIPRYQAIQNSLKTLGGSLSVKDIHEIAKEEGYPNRGTRLLTKKKTPSVDDYYVKVSNINKIADKKQKKSASKSLLKEIRSINKVKNLETWKNIEILLNKWIKE
jgi:predicted DNA-binding protein YlxM (UPF0122 family)